MIAGLAIAVVALVLYAAGMTLAWVRAGERAQGYRSRMEGSAAQLAAAMTDLAAAHAIRPRVVRVDVGPGGQLEVEVNGQPLRGTVVREVRDGMSSARLLVVDLDAPADPVGPAEALMYALDAHAVPV